MEPQPGGRVLAIGECGHVRLTTGEGEQGPDTGGGVPAGCVGVEGENRVAVEGSDVAGLGGGELAPGLGEGAVTVA
jgi:hypothetical protein